MSVASPRSNAVARWAAWILPVVLIGLLVGLFLRFNPIGSLRAVPPAEAVAFERVTFERGRIELSLRNDGPDPVQIAQVLVNDAYWAYSMPDSSLGRLERGVMTIDYPWESGLPVNIALVTSTGLTIEHEVEAAALTPAFDAGTWTILGLLGVYIGLIPVMIGILWFPALAGASKRWLTFFLAFTLGLLAFLLLDTVAEGLEFAAVAPAALDGLALFALGALGAVLVLQAFGRTVEGTERGVQGLALAYLIAAGIGLHNLGEGLAVGAALAAGEVALGTFLVLGFAIHNTTEGLAIVAPLGSSRHRPALWHFVSLGVIAGAPASIGAWAGGFAFSAAVTALMFGVAAGAIVQVIWQIGSSMGNRRELTGTVGAAGLLVGFVFMYLTGLLTA